MRCFSIAKSLILLVLRTGSLRGQLCDLQTQARAESASFLRNVAKFFPSRLRAKIPTRASPSRLTSKVTLCSLLGSCMFTSAYHRRCKDLAVPLQRGSFGIVAKRDCSCRIVCRQYKASLCMCRPSAHFPSWNLTLKHLWHASSRRQ